MNVRPPIDDVPEPGDGARPELSRIAHDLNNELLVIRGHASVLRPTLADEQQRSDVDEIVEAADRAALICRQLSALSRGAEPA